MLTRHQARQSPCPKCGARAGQHCKRKNGEIRRRNHCERLGVIREADGITPGPSGNLGETEALSFAVAYLRNLERDKTVSGLTPREEEIGDHALAAMNIGRALLLKRHSRQRRQPDGSSATAETREGLYNAAVGHLAFKLKPLMSGTCHACSLQMPEIVTNLCLRCPECRQVMDEQWRRRAPVTRIQEQQAASLLESYMVLGVQPTASIETVRRALDDQFSQIRWALSESAPDELKPTAASALTALNTAWNRIRNHLPAYES